MKNVINSISLGERSRVIAYLAVAICGAAIGYAVVLHLAIDGGLDGSLSGFEIWMIAAGAMGSAIALYLAGDRFGRPGLRGLGTALVASVWVSFVGSVIGGSLMMPLYGTMFGPFTFAVTLASSPFLAVLWFLNLLGAHSLLCTWRKERDSIFDTPNSGASSLAKPMVQPREGRI